MPFHTGLSASLVERADNALIRIQATRPIASVDSTRLILMRDSLPLPFQLETLNDVGTILVKADIDQGSSIGLTVEPKAVRDIYGGTNDTLRASFGRAAEESTGTLRVEMKHLPDSSAYLLQLLDAQQRVVQESALDLRIASVKWDRLVPGLRTLRLTADSNRNGRWDTGEWATLVQPERTWHHPDAVNVRAAWDVVVDWDLKEP
jgi:hypothetical protein